MSYAAEIFGRNGKHGVSAKGEGANLFSCFSFKDAHNAARLLKALEDDGEAQDALLSWWGGEDVDGDTLRAEMARHGVKYE